MRAVRRVLAGFHRGARQADLTRHLEHLSAGAVVLVTDPKEHFTRKQYAVFLESCFERGQGWTSIPKRQHVFFAPGERVAWSNQTSVRRDGGRLRCTGLVRQTPDGWRIAHVSATIPGPNALAGELPAMVQAASKRQ